MDPKRLLGELRSSTREAIGDSKRVAVAWSGGVDSSVIEALAREVAEVTCYICAVKGAHDWNLIQELRATERRDTKLLELTHSDLLRYVPQAAIALDSVRPVEVAYTIPFVCVLDRAEEELVLAGSGADELFGGYAKYAAVDDPRGAMKSDLEKMLGESAKLQKAAQSMGKRLGFPFVADEVVKLASGLPTKDLLGPGGRKLVLREVAVVLGLESYDRPKKAAQYSSGIMREMERLARKEKLTVSEWTEKMARSGRATA